MYLKKEFDDQHVSSVLIFKLKKAMKMVQKIISLTDIYGFFGADFSWLLSACLVDFFVCILDVFALMILNYGLLISKTHHSKSKHNAFVF